MKKLLVVLGLAGLAVGGWRWHGRATHPTAEVTDGGGNKLLVDRLWLDHIPRNPRDIINIFVAITEEPVGMFEARSVWTGTFEAFRYTRGGGELRTVFPQTGAKETFKVKARSCDEQGMDFCLEISGGNHGVKRYYSREGWEIRHLADESRLLEQLAHE